MVRSYDCIDGLERNRSSLLLCWIDHWKSALLVAWQMVWLGELGGRVIDGPERKFWNGVRSYECIDGLERRVLELKFCYYYNQYSAEVRQPRINETLKSEYMYFIDKKNYYFHLWSREMIYQIKKVASNYQHILQYVNGSFSFCLYTYIWRTKFL